MQVVIHAGAAFTDHGQLLGSLLANRSGLADRGLAVLGPRPCRQFVKEMSDAQVQDRPFAEAQETLRGILPDGEAIRRVVLSSDKFFGPRRTALQQGQIYPFAGQRTAYTAQLLGDCDINLFVGLMNPGSFIPKVLMSLHETQREAILHSTDLSCLNWLSMIEDLQDLASDVQLTLWENEDTPLIWGDILRAMAALPEDVALKDEHALLASLLTETGKKQLLQLIREETAQHPRDRREKLETIFEEHALPDQIEEELHLPGWSADVVDAFSELYQQDLAKIRAMPNIRFLQP